MGRPLPHQPLMPPLAVHGAQPLTHYMFFFWSSKYVWLISVLLRQFSIIDYVNP